MHGTLETGKPFEAGFELYGDEWLTPVLEIVRSYLPTAEFAFLSACHTTEMADGSIMDEGLHLAGRGAILRIRSVVGTMWEMVDGTWRRTFTRRCFLLRDEIRERRTTKVLLKFSGSR
jgi:CHAT domain-containing protein